MVLGRSQITSSTAASTTLWPVVVLLTIVVLVPSATVVWLTMAAVRNERAAMRERLVEAYTGRLRIAVADIDEHWRDIEQRVRQLSVNNQRAALFRACVDEDLADSILVISPNGRLLYPAPIGRGTDGTINEEAWAAARQLEFADKRLQSAAEAYAAIARVEPFPAPELAAWLAHARCLTKSGRETEAIDVLMAESSRPAMKACVDEQGRRLWLDAQLRLLDLLSQLPDRKPEAAEQLRIVREFLDDYDQTVSSAQRSFVMREVLAIAPESGEFATQRAERLALRVSDRLINASSTPRAFGNARDTPHVVMLNDAPVLLLFEEDSLTQRLKPLVDEWQMADAAVFLTDAEDDTALTSVPIASMPGHRLSLNPADPDFFRSSARQKTIAYTTAGILTVACLSIVSVAIAVAVRRRLRVAQLRNQLAAVVTHELRTPLASVRVLVDTLIENDASDPDQTADYLQLIAAENERLSRLIDNFLTFSRLERNGERFEMTRLDPTEPARRAIAALNGKLHAPGCEFELRKSSTLPFVHADSDAMVTVLLNLLENALKFTGEEKQITLSVRAAENRVTYEVEDNGIGMNAHEARRAFRQFFQADNRLSRNYGGCGLGLSLVRSIVNAHSGSVEVRSRPDSGSVFTIHLPAIERSALTTEDAPA